MVWYNNKKFNSTVSEGKYTRRDNRSLEERFDSGKRGIMHHEPLNPNYSKTFREERDAESQPFWSRAWNALSSGLESTLSAYKKVDALFSPTNGDPSMGASMGAGAGQIGLAMSLARENGTSWEAEDAKLTEQRKKRREEQKQKAFEDAEKHSKSAAAKLEKAKKGTSGLGSFALDAVSQVPQLAGDALLNAVVPGLGMSALGVRAFGDSAYGAHEAGLSDDEVLGMKGVKTFAKGASGAAIEMLSEGLFDAFGGKIYGKGLADEGLDDLIKSMTTNETKRWALRMAKDMVGEGAEEAVSDILNWSVSAALGFKDQEGKLLDGYDSFGDAVRNVLYDFAVGGVLGGIGGSVQNTIRTKSAVRTNKIASQVYSDTESSAALLNRAVELDVVQRAGKENKNITKAMETLKQNTKAGKTSDGATLRAVAEAVAQAEVETKSAANTAKAKQQLVKDFHVSEAQAAEMAKAIGYYATQSQVSQSNDVFLQAAAQYAVDEHVKFYDENLLRSSPAAMSILNMVNGVLPDAATVEKLRTQGGKETLGQEATASLRQRLKEKGVGKTAETRMNEGLQKAAQETLLNHLAQGVVHEYTDGTRTLELAGVNGQAIEVDRDTFIQAVKEQGFPDSKSDLGKLFDALTKKSDTVKEDTAYEGRAEQRRADERGAGRGDGRSVRGRVDVRDDGLSGSAGERTGESGRNVSEAARGAEGQVRGQDVAGDGRSNGKKQRAVGEGSGRGTGKSVQVNRAAVKTVYEEHPDAFLQQEIRPGVSVYTLKAKGAKYLGEKLVGELRLLKARNATVTRGGAAPELRFIKDMFPLASGKEANGAQRGNEIFVSLTGTRSATETYEHELGHAIFKRDTALRDKMTGRLESYFSGEEELFTEFKRAYEPYVKMYGRDIKGQKHVMKRVYEELLCDLNAGVNRGNWMPSSKFKKMSAAVQSSLNSWINEGADERAMLNAGYSMDEQLDNLREALEEYKEALKNGKRDELADAKSYLNTVSLALPHSPSTMKTLGMADLHFGLSAGHALVGHEADLTLDTLRQVMEHFDDNVLFITKGDDKGKANEKRMAALEYDEAMKRRDLTAAQKDIIARRKRARERSAEQMVEVYMKDPTNNNRVLKLPLYPSHPANEGVDYSRTSGLPRLDNFIKTAFVVGSPAYFAQKAMNNKSLVYYNADNLSVGGLGELATQLDGAYGKSDKAIYRIKDAREYAMLPDDYEALPKEDKKAIQGISDKLTHMTDLLDAFDAAYTHPIEGAKDVESYYLLTNTFPSAEVAKFAVYNAYDKVGVSEVIATADNGFDIMDAATGEISTLVVAPAGDNESMLNSDGKGEGWKVYWDGGELPIVSPKVTAADAEKVTTPEGDIHDIVDLDESDSDFYFEEKDLVDFDDGLLAEVNNDYGSYDDVETDWDDLFALGEKVVKMIDEHMAPKTAVDPVTGHVEMDPGTYQIKSQLVDVSKLSTPQEKRMVTDTQGTLLTVGQAEYFAKSIARDTDGRLLVMYHGTSCSSLVVLGMV